MYGGTRSEMERLLSDASKISGQKYDISNLSDVYEAIHVVQKEMDITGTTSKEAAKTLSGSFNSMKAAAVNFAGQLATGNGKDVKKAFKNLISATGTFVIKNLIPTVGKVFKNLGSIIVNQVPTLLKSATQALDKVIDNIANGGDSDKLLIAGVKWAGKIAMGLIKGAVNITDALLKLMSSLLGLAATAAARLVVIGVKWAANLAKGFLSGGVKKLKQAFNSVAEKANAMKQKLSKTFSSIGKIFTNWVNKVKSVVNKVKDLLKNVISYVTGAFSSGWRRAWNAVVNTFKRIWNGLKNGIKAPINAAIDVINGFIGKLNNFSIKLPKVLGGGTVGFNVSEIGHLAKGTRNWQGGPAIVGEHGPELVNLPKAASVNTAGETRRMQTGNTVNIAKLADTIVVRKKQDIQDLAYALAKEINQARADAV